MTSRVWQATRISTTPCGSVDPTFRLLGSKKSWDRAGALTSRLQSFETGMLASDEILIGLMAVNRELFAEMLTRRPVLAARGG